MSKDKKFDNRGYYTTDELQSILDNSEHIEDILLPVRLILSGEKMDTAKILKFLIDTLGKKYTLKINAFKVYDDKKGRYDPNKMRVEIRVFKPEWL